MTKWKGGEIVSVLGLALLLVVLHTANLDRYGYWEDEIYTARDVGIHHLTDRNPTFRLSFSKLTYHNDNHPPFYFLAMSWWVRSFGYSEISGRGFSVLIFLFFLLAVAVAAREWAPGHRWAPFWAMACFGLSLHLYMAVREARMYSLALLWVILSLLFYVRMTEGMAGDRQSRIWTTSLGFVLAATLGLYTHYYFAFLYAAEVLVAAFLYFRHRLASKFVPALLAPGLLFLPWLPQLARQYERKYEPGLWTLGPQSWPSYLHSLSKEGSAALLRILFGSTFGQTQLLVMFVLAVVLYWILVRKAGTGTRFVALIGAVTVVAYGLLAANDFFHHTVTLTYTKYLFFIVVPLLMVYILVALGNLAPVRFILLASLLGFNLVGVLRGRQVQAHPDWRAISETASRALESHPLLVSDDDYWTCLAFYLPQAERVRNEEWVSVYPKDFWYLVIYLPWNSTMQRRVADLQSRFEEVERIPIDRFSMLVRFRVKDDR